MVVETDGATDTLMKQRRTRCIDFAAALTIGTAAGTVQLLGAGDAPNGIIHMIKKALLP